MGITVRAGGQSEVYIHPIYKGISFPYKLSEGRENAGMITWFHRRLENGLCL